MILRFERGERCELDLMVHTFPPRPFAEAEVLEETLRCGCTVRHGGRRTETMRRFLQ